MILDARLEFCDATSVAASAGTALLGSQIDLGSTTSDIGIGQPLWLVIQTDTEIITAGSAGTIQFKLCSDSTASIHATTSTEHYATPAYVTDDAAVNSSQLNVGGVIACVALPSGTYERYLGINCIVGTTEVTAGKINAFLTHDPAKWLAYPDGI